jgi:hypothetical protein
MYVGWPNALPRAPPPPPVSNNRRRKWSTEPKPFPGFLPKPLCEACEQGADSCPKTPGSPPPLMTFTRGRRRPIDTQTHFRPAPNCSSHGWRGRGNIRANGLPTRCQSSRVIFYLLMVPRSHTGLGWHRRVSGHAALSPASGASDQQSLAALAHDSGLCPDTRCRWTGRRHRSSWPHVPCGRAHGAVVGYSYGASQPADACHSVV